MKKKLILFGVAGIVVLSGAAGLYFFPPPLPSFWPFSKGAEEVSATVSGHETKTPEHAAAEAKPKHNTPEIRQETHDEPDTGEDTGHGKDPEGEVHSLELAMPRNESRIIERVRKLHLVQSAAAAGVTIPGFGQRAALRDVEEELGRSDPLKLTDQELQSVAVYILSGGDPELVEAMLVKLPRSNRMHKVLEGAVAFSQAKKEDAEKLFADLDLSDYPRTLSARLALAQAQLAEGHDAKARRKLLMIAANLSPGTLVEEAATRRLIAFFGSEGDVEGFLQWSERYARRFPRSLYTSEFEVSFAVALLRLEKENGKIAPARIIGILGRLNRASATRILLKVSQKAAIAGMRDLCIDMTTLGLTSYNQTGEIDIRFNLYQSACTVVTDTQRALDRLTSIDRRTMADDDLSLLDDATQLATAILADNIATLEDAERPPVEQPEVGNDTLLASVAQQLETTKDALNKAGQ
ncbi:MAG: hypothetical protein LCH46_06800 [Proteobacteria bacterium]|nr:hypothetical protein [Pseudomonadota bacterium]